MLTFILVVVLGGGVGYLVVSLAESDKPATDAGGDQREPEPEPHVHDPSPLAPAIPDDPGEAVAAGSGPTRVRTRAEAVGVPRAHTAVEGRYADVAGAPLWRRMLALVGIVVITVAVGVAIAAILAAVFGTLAELLSTAIG